MGRNVAEMELALIVATVARGWEWVLREEEMRGEGFVDGQGNLATREGFLRKPVGCLVGIRRRER